MTKLSTTVIAVEATDYARREFEWLRNNRVTLFGVDIAMLDDNTDQMGMHCLMMKAMRSATDMMDVVDYARAGWLLAYEACKNLILEFENNRMDKPQYLAAYAMELIRNGPPAGIRGRQGNQHFFRDICITIVITTVCERFHLKPTRGRFATKPSGCSIVAQVLNMAEATVVDIWRRCGMLNLSGQFAK